MNDIRLPQADKNFGQHFLTSQSIIDKITTDYVNKATAILEVGPGPGVLTYKLKESGLPLCLIEKDLRFREYLQEILSDDKVLFSDALNVDLGSFLKDHYSEQERKYLWLVSNLPYNVSVPLTLLFTKEPMIEVMTLMFQKEVGDKILNQAKKWNNNSLHVLCNNFFVIDELCKVPPESFSPAPKVDSIVLSFERKECPIIPLEEFTNFERFLRNIFQQKRKQLQKVLKFSYKSQEIGIALEKAELDPAIRAEKLTIDQVYKLYNSLLK